MFPFTATLGRPSIRFRFRTTLLTVMVTVVIATVGFMGYGAYSGAQKSSADLTSQIIEQASIRVEQRIESILTTANNQGRLDKSLFDRQEISVDDLPRVVAYWRSVMEVQPFWRVLALNFGDSNIRLRVTRLNDGRLEIQESRPIEGTDEKLIRRFLPDGYPDEPLTTTRVKTATVRDVRQTPGFVEAEKTRQQVWSETYFFRGPYDTEYEPGVTCATPLMGTDNSVFAVIRIDFALKELSRIVREIEVGKTGIAFVIEMSEDGSHRLIAHPDPMVRLDVHNPDTCATDVSRAPDPRVKAFLAALPAAQVDQNDHSFTFSAGGKSYFGGFRKPQLSPAPNWMVGILLPEEDVLDRVYAERKRVSMIGGLALSISIITSMLIARTIAGRLEELAEEAARIGRLSLDSRPVHGSSIIEIDRLATAIEETKSGLRSFKKYVPVELVRRLIKIGEDATLGGENRELSIYFCDVASFTEISERLAPSDLLLQLGAYLGEFSRGVAATGGTVDKYIGDAVMAFWGAPELLPGHALAACQAALANQAALRVLNQRWEQEGRPPFHVRAGIHTGEVIVGNIGSEARLNYTVIGDAVNLASRLEGLNKYYGTELIISETTYDACRGTVVARPLDWVSVKGKQKPVLVYELLGLADAATPAARQLVEQSRPALQAYRDRDFATAIRRFEEILVDYPQDVTATLLRDRCQAFARTPPPPDWDGANRMSQK